MLFKDFFKENIAATIAKTIGSFAYDAGDKIGTSTKFGQALRKGYSSVKKQKSTEFTNPKKIKNKPQK
jgi:hypothetical protein